MGLIPEISQDIYKATLEVKEKNKRYAHNDTFNKINMKNKQTLILAFLLSLPAKYIIFEGSNVWFSNINKH